jgi:hypothetical protein
VRARHYSPAISRLLVCALYHEAKRQRKPMTHLLDEIVQTALSQSAAMHIALRTFPQESGAQPADF